MKHRVWKPIVGVVSVIGCLGFLGVPGYATNQRAPVPTPAPDQLERLTPAPGDPLRAAVLDALREWLRTAHGLDVVFVVRHLRVKDGWAWVHAGPQSPDGSQRYEDVSALLRQRESLWTVAEIPCTEVDNPQCLGDPGYLAGLRERFPDAPPEIFPDWEDERSATSGTE